MGNSRTPIALRAALSTAIPVLIGWAAGDIGAGLMGTIGAFTSRFGLDRPYLNRGVQLAVVAISLAVAVTLGAWAASVPWAGVLVVSAVAVIAVWLCNALAVGPPGAYIFVVACAAGIGASAAHLAPWRIGLLVLAGGAIAWVVQMADALLDFRKPERAAVAATADAVAAYLDDVGSADERQARHRAATALHRSWSVLVSYQPVDPSRPGTLQRLRATNHALHVLFSQAMAAGSAADGAADRARALGRLELDPATIVDRADRVPLGAPSTGSRLRHAVAAGSHVRHVMARVAIGVPIAGGIAALLGISHAYWAMAAAVLVLHLGADRARTLRRGAQRLLGTWLGLGLAAAVLATHPQGWWLALVLALLSFAIEMLVVRNYTLACVFITATALTIGSAGHRVDVSDLLLARGLDTAIGCAVGAIVFLATVRYQEATRLLDATADTLAAIATTSEVIADTDALALRARAARRDLQVITLAMTDAGDAALSGSPRQRQAAERAWPVVLATEHLAYRTVAACWAMERGGPTGDSLFAPAGVEVYVASLRALAQAVHDAGPPRAPIDAPAFVADEMTALYGSLARENG